MIVSSLTDDINSIGLMGLTGRSPAEEAAAKADNRFAELLTAEEDAKATLAEITEKGAKGYWEWKIREMRKQIAAEVMGEMNLTAEKIAQMPAKERLEVETKILDMVEQRLKLAIVEEMKKKQEVLLGLSVNTQALLNATQEAGALL